MATAGKAEGQNEEVALRLAEEVWNEGEYEVVDELIADDCVAYYPGLEPVRGPAEYKQLVQEFHEVYPDFQVEVTNLFSDGDNVAVQYEMTGTQEGTIERPGMELPATGATVEVDGIVVSQLEDGKIVEEYNRSDALTMLDQLGIMG